MSAVWWAGVISVRSVEVIAGGRSLVGVFIFFFNLLISLAFILVIFDISNSIKLVLAQLLLDLQHKK